jgi:hypothetical protein
MNVKIKSKNVAVSGRNIVITKEQEETLAMRDLINIKMGTARQKEQIVEQMKNLKKQYGDLEEQEIEVNGMIEQLKEIEEELPEIANEK